MNQNLNANDLLNTAAAYVGDTFSSARYLGGTNNGWGDAWGNNQSQAVRWLNEGQTKMCMNLGIEGFSQMNAIVGQRLYDIPDTVSRVKACYYNGSKLRLCRYVDHDWFSQGSMTYADRYTIWNGKVILGILPPSSTYIIKLIYWREPRLLADPNDIADVPNRFRMGVSSWCGSRMAVADDNFQLAKELKDEFLMYKRDFNNWIDDQSVENLQVSNETDGWYFFRI